MQSNVIFYTASERLVCVPKRNEDEDVSLRYFTIVPSSSPSLQHADGVSGCMHKTMPRTAGAPQSIGVKLAFDRSLSDSVIELRGIEVCASHVLYTPRLH